MGTIIKDPLQMTEREKRTEEFKQKHRTKDLESLRIMERSMMLRILVFLVDGPKTSRAIYVDGEFNRSSLLKNKLRILEDSGLIVTQKQKKYTMVTLTEMGYEFARQLYALMRFLKRRKK